FFEPCAPDCLHAIALLQDGLHLFRAPAAYKAEMASVGTCHQFDDGRCLAMPPDADDDRLVTPFHELDRSNRLLSVACRHNRLCREANRSVARKFKPHFTVALRIVDP